ncbi:MAG: UDP-N-acetylmuramoyl-L-alanine--D-glutamate ligase [Gemmatimonadota bacterium]|nr:UDP-N-acetylmuramoyl-L-alanine--D-glutamate ligase [Gemmatimonadota bacterium]
MATVRGAREVLPAAWLAGEISVIGLGKSGRAVSTLLQRAGARVYASDAGSSPAVAEAAATLQASGVAADVGRHALDRIRRASLVVVSPGVPPTSAAPAAAREAGVPIVGEVEIALRFLPDARYIAITGSNGKTTTTAIAGELLTALGVRAVTAGNIGTALAELPLRDHPPDWIALEISSFQLHDMPSIAPAVGVLTNLSPNHLDRYVSLEEYYADKALLFRNAAPHSRWVSNADDPDSQRLVRGVAGAHRTFSVSRAADAYLDRPANRLVVFGAPLLARDEFALLGDHNVANALAAALAVMLADEAHATPSARGALADALRRFRALEHRNEPVGELGGVLWVNDSKSTSVAATQVALRGMTRPTVLLLGGRHKGEPYTALAADVARTVRTVVAYGEAAPIVERDLGRVVPVERLGSSFPEVIRRARDLARPGDAVLLSPACSSYDMFANYEERGAAFKRLVEEAVAVTGGSRTP